MLGADQLSHIVVPFPPKNAPLRLSDLGAMTGTLHADPFGFFAWAEAEVPYAG